jgi:hypothetical protein
MRVLRAGALLSLSVAVGLACAKTVQVHESSSDHPLAIHKLAIAPFEATPRPGEPPLRGDAADLVATYLTDALAKRGLEVVVPSDFVQQTGIGADTAAPIDPRAAAAAAAASFGADAVVLGSVYRFRPRVGGAGGSVAPASVGFVVRIYSAPEPHLLWRGQFDQTQEALTSNVFVTSQYPGGGTRWLTIEEFARWGADEMAKSIPLAE